MGGKQIAWLQTRMLWLMPQKSPMCDAIPFQATMAVWNNLIVDHPSATYGLKRPAGTVSPP